MPERPVQYRLSHLVVRLIAAINLADLGLATLYPPYFHALDRTYLGEVMVKWEIASSLLLPLFVGFEAWWMRKSKLESRASLIDTAFAAVWFLVLWIGVAYACTHHAIL